MEQKRIIINSEPEIAPTPVKPDVKPETKPGEKKKKKWSAPKPLVQPRPKA